MTRDRASQKSREQDGAEHAGSRDRVECDADERQRADQPQQIERIADLERRFLEGRNRKQRPAGLSSSRSSRCTKSPRGA